MSEAPAGGIFVSYAREEGLRPAREVVERLRAEFGDHRVFVGENELSFGDELGASLDRKLNASSVVLVLIGPWWLPRAATKAGRWLDHEDNFARHEIRAALQRGLHVIPVLVDGADLPRPEALPEDLRPLVQRQALALDAARMDRDVSLLIRALRNLLGQEDTQEEAVTPAEGPSAAPGSRPPSGPSASGVDQPVVALWHTALTTSLTHTRRRVAQVLHPLGGEVLPAITVWRAAFWLGLAALLLWGVVWPYLWPALMPTPAAVTVADETLPAATGPVLPAGTRFRDCRDATCPWLRVLPAGTFTMGSPDDEPGRDKDEGPQHQVTVTRSFAVMETEVTVFQFELFVGETGYRWDRTCSFLLTQTKGDPAVCVSWRDASVFARWMARRTGQPYRLLSEAEWEYAARAGTATPFAFGDRINTSQANFNGEFTYNNSTTGEYRRNTLPVGSLAPNAWGLYDMHGNAAEWVQDCRHDYALAARAASAVESKECPYRVQRGGGWGDGPRFVRSAGRVHGEPDDLNDDTGFRLARMLP